MYAFRIILSVDTALGRVDYNSLSDQMLIEMLIDGYDDDAKENYRDLDDTYLDICEWPCVLCDDDQRVEKMYETQDVSGSLDLSCIPPKMKEIYIDENGLVGEIDLTNFPESMELLNLSDNMLAGSTDLTHLSRKMKYINLCSNQFSGTIDITQLPAEMLVLYLDANFFTGTIELTKLPQSMRELTLHNNRFTGPFIATNLPQHLQSLNASGNRFDAVAVAELGKVTKVTVEKSGVTSVVDENENRIFGWVCF